MIRFLTDRSGGFSIIFALVVFVLVSSVGFVVDYTIYTSQRLAMKQSLEAGVLAAVREAPVQGWDEDTIEAVIDTYVDTNLREASFGSAEYRLKVMPHPEKGRVRALLYQNDHGYLLLGHIRKNPQIVVEAEAAIVSSANICVLTLHPDNRSTVKLTGMSTLTGRNCGVFANSQDAKAIEVESRSRIEASHICSAGGYAANSSDTRPRPQTDCPVIADPLAHRAPPSSSGCDFRDIEIKQSRSLRPGVYCGGIRIGGDVDIRLEPGIFVIKDGEFSVTGNATLKGENVGFYVTGKTARISFANSTTIALTAPRDGPMAGILLFEDRNSPYGREFEISSKDAEMLLGTIYLPRGLLSIKGPSKFAGAAAWTAVIAQEIRTEVKSELEFNSDYAATDIPVPAGVGSIGSQVRLTR